MSKPRPRPLLIGILVAMALIPALVGHGMPTYAGPLFAPPAELAQIDLQRDINEDLNIPVSRFEGGTGFAGFNIVNSMQTAGHLTGTVTLDIPDLPAGWVATFNPPPPYVFANTIKNIRVTLRLDVPANTPPVNKNLQVRATALTDKLPARPIYSDLEVLRVITTAGPAVAGSGCPDSPAPGSDFGNARLLRVDTYEIHGLCAAGEQDWFKFGAVGGKYYTIEIVKTDPGLDLALDLFDKQHNQLTSNDDYPFRPPFTPVPITPTPVPTPSSTPEPAPRGILPLIKSFRAPYDGLFYVRVRDAASVGGDNATYQIIIRSESYGAEPVLVPEVCNDRYEPDGLPENARLIMINDIQTDHRLCPSGDADWVKFYATAGQSYLVFASTTKHYPRGTDSKRLPIGEPGADTQLLLFGPNGRTVWGTNDNVGTVVISGTPDMTSTLLNPLDSAILFQPAASAFYYAQVKNNGDIGGQQILYDVSVVNCLSNSLPICNNLGKAVTEPANNAGAQPGTGLAPDVAGFAFFRLWQADDEPVARKQASRSWTWAEWNSNRPPRQLAERYDQAPGGMRQVAYFDKGRMEVNNPTGDPKSRWFITSGRLVAELITGSIQTGDTTAEQRSPANIPIAGNADDPNGPTYASFGGATSLSSSNRKGDKPSEQIYRNGRFGPYAGANDSQTEFMEFVDATRHNIPKVFWDYLRAPGMNWVYVLGYPLSEPYWASVLIGTDQKPKYVLIQPFERRVLTYNPANEPPFRVEMGNVGLHYYQWRYGAPLTN